MRGHGTSRPLPGAPRRASFDTYLLQDVPASLDRMRDVTGEESVVWVGHSLGALLGLASCGVYPGRIHAFVAIAGPAHFHAQEVLKRLLRHAWIVSGRWNRFLARSLAPFSGVWHPSIGDLAINARNVERPIYRRMLANGHTDLIYGRGAPEEIFARVRDWLVAHSELG